MIRWAIAATFAFVFSACSGRVDSEKRLGDGDESKCAYVGNDPSRRYCATTYIQVLADPDFYDGRRIMITAWGASNEGVVIIFPNEDSMLMVETHASMRVKDGVGLAELERYLASMKYGRQGSCSGVFFICARETQVSLGDSEHSVMWS